MNHDDAPRILLGMIEALTAGWRAEIEAREQTRLALDCARGCMAEAERRKKAKEEAPF